MGNAAALQPWSGGADDSAQGGALPRHRLALAVGVSLALHGMALAWLSPRPYQPLPSDMRITASLAPIPAAAPNPAAPQAHDAGGPGDTAASAPPPRPAVPESALPPAPESSLAPTSGSVRYFLASELDQRPEPLRLIEPESPADRKLGPGRVMMRVLIDERGRVDDAIVMASEPAGAYDSTARAAFAAARFSPGVRQGIAVKSQLLVEVTFAAAGASKGGS